MGSIRKINIEPNVLCCTSEDKLSFGIEEKLRKAKKDLSVEVVGAEILIHKQVSPHSTTDNISHETLWAEGKGSLPSVSELTQKTIRGDNASLATVATKRQSAGDLAERPQDGITQDTIPLRREKTVEKTISMVPLDGRVDKESHINLKGDVPGNKERAKYQKMSFSGMENQQARYLVSGEPERMTYHFRRWGETHSVIICDKPDGTLILKPSDMLVRERLGSALHERGENEKWKLDPHEQRGEREQQNNEENEQ